MRSLASNRRARLFPLALLALGAVAADLPAVTAGNLLESERFWPYRVTLTEPFQPEGREAPLPSGTAGVLIRVEPDEVARIDFSADGKLRVPVGKTDLVASANRIRAGEQAKELPNFVHAIRSRLVDSGADPLAGLHPEALGGRTGFLCVFADPADADFPALAAALAPLADRRGVLTLLFPQGSHPDHSTASRLRSLGWSVPFVYDHLSEPYTRTLLEVGTPMPALLLQTDEGRVVYQDGFRADAVPELVAALDAAFGDASSPAVAAGAGENR